MEPWPANPPPQCDGGEKCSINLQKGLTPEGKPPLLIKVRNYKLLVEDLGSLPAVTLG